MGAGLDNARKSRGAMKRSCRLGLFRVKQMVAARGVKQHAPTAACGSWRMFCVKWGVCEVLHAVLFLFFADNRHAESADNEHCACGHHHVALHAA